MPFRKKYNSPAQINKQAGQQVKLMVAIVSQQFIITTQLSFNLIPKQKSSKLPKPDEKPLFPGFYLIIVNNYKTVIVSNKSLNPAHPIAIAQAKLQPKD